MRLTVKQMIRNVQNFPDGRWNIFTKPRTYQTTFNRFLETAESERWTKQDLFPVWASCLCCLWHSECPGHTMAHLETHWQLASGLLTLSSPRLRLSRCNLHSYNCYDTHSSEIPINFSCLEAENWPLQERESSSSAATGGPLRARSESKCCLGPFSCLVYNDHPELSSHNASEEYQRRSWDTDIYNVWMTNICMSPQNISLRLHQDHQNADREMNKHLGLPPLVEWQTLRTQGLVQTVIVGREASLSHSEASTIDV